MDAINPASSNWMRFINCARSEEEQNITAYQFEGEVFYRTHIDVTPGTELLVSIPLYCFSVSVFMYCRTPFFTGVFFSQSGGLKDSRGPNVCSCFFFTLLQLYYYEVFRGFSKNCEIREKDNPAKKRGFTVFVPTVVSTAARHFVCVEIRVLDYLL